jgi:hypothetical protein
MSIEGPQTEPRSSFGHRTKSYFASFGQRAMIYLGLRPDVQVATVSTNPYRQRLIATGLLLAIGVVLWFTASANTAITVVVIGMAVLFVSPAVHRAMEWWDNYSSD